MRQSARAAGLFSAALVAFEDLAAVDTLELLAKAPTPVEAARLTITQIGAALKRARRRNVSDKAERIQAALHADHLGQSEVVTLAYAASVRALAAVLEVLNEQITTLQGQVEAHFGRHPATETEIVLSQPGLGPILGARVLAEGRRRPLRPQRPADRRDHGPSIRCLTASPGAHAYYDKARARGAEHNPALRQLANRLVGILHGCLTTGTLYDKATAWSHRVEKAAA